MRRFRRLLLIAAILVFVLAAAAGLGFRWIVDPAGLRATAEARLTALLGQPVTIGTIDFTFVPSPAVMGGDIRIGASDQTAPSIQLSRVRIVPRVRTLISGPVAIEGVTLEGLDFRVLRDAGHWRVPPIVPAAGGNRGLTIERVLLRDARIRVVHARPDGPREASITGINGEVVAEPTGLRAKPLTGRIGGAAIEGEAVITPATASLSFRTDRVEDSDLPELIGLMGSDRPSVLRLAKPIAASVSIDIDRARSRLSGRGSVRAPEVMVDALRLQSLEAPYTTDGVRFIFEPAAFDLYRGKHGGRFTIDLSKSPAQWLLTNRISDLAIGELLAALSGRDQRVDGIAAMDGSFRGRVGDPLDRVEGTTHVTVVNGAIREFPLLAAINRALRLAEGDSRDTKFERLTATFTLGGRQAVTNDLVLVAREVRVEAAGRIGFDRGLDLAGQAVLSPERTASAIRSVRELSSLRNARGELEIPLTITGTADHPSIAIDMQAAIARALKEELRRRLLGIFKR